MKNFALLLAIMLLCVVSEREQGNTLFKPHPVDIPYMYDDLSQDCEECQERIRAEANLANMPLNQNAPKASIKNSNSNNQAPIENVSENLPELPKSIGQREIQPISTDEQELNGNSSLNEEREEQKRIPKQKVEVESQSKPEEISKSKGEKETKKTNDSSNEIEPLPANRQQKSSEYSFREENTLVDLKRTPMQNGHADEQIDTEEMWANLRHKESPGFLVPVNRDKYPQPPEHHPRRLSPREFEYTRYSEQPFNFGPDIYREEPYLDSGFGYPEPYPRRNYYYERPSYLDTPYDLHENWEYSSPYGKERYFYFGEGPDYWEEMYDRHQYFVRERLNELRNRKYWHLRRRF